jgi:hypothetical protein
MPTKINKSPLTVIPPQLITMGIKGLAGGLGEVLRDRKEAKDAGEKYSFKEGLGDFGRGLASGVTGMDFTDQREAEEQPTYKTNIDPMTGEEIPLMMTGNMKPLKMLTGIKGNIPHNMSAAQYKSALKMSEISGAAPLQSNAFYASLNAAKEKGADTFDVGGKTFNVK